MDSGKCISVSFSQRKIKIKRIAEKEHNSKEKGHNSTNKGHNSKGKGA